MEKKLNSIDLMDIHIDDSFWNRYTSAVKGKILPYQWNVLNDRETEGEPSHCIRNFRRAAGEEQGGFYGFVFQDSDLAKWIEAAAYSLITLPDPSLEADVDAAVDLVARAQQDDGYLDTFFILNAPKSKWKNLREGHELYCAGHFMEAAVAYYRATGKEKLLKVVCKTADLICSVFMSREYACAIPGHEEVEIGLIRLYELTKKTRYLDMARSFIHRRGQDPTVFDTEQSDPNWIRIFSDLDQCDHEYYQCHKSVYEQSEAVGHAVRAVYLYNAMAEIAAVDNDTKMLNACRRLYNNIVLKRMYITGGIGTSGCLERFTTDYDLPCASGYSETCAGIGLALFCRRMAQITHEAHYVDTMERVLMNNVLAGISLDGNKFFYVNPLEVWPDNCLPHTSMEHVKPTRQKWFGCACCPPNLARTLASLGEYVCFKGNYRNNDSLWLNLFVSCTLHTRINNTLFFINITSDFPHGGNISLEIIPEIPTKASLYLRIPGYAASWSLLESGTVPNYRVEAGYLCITRVWEKTTLALELEIPSRLVYPNPQIRGCAGKVAIMKGPLVFCLEQQDNGSNLAGLFLDTKSELRETYEPDLMGGTTVIRTQGYRFLEDKEYPLYSDEALLLQPTQLTFVPYHLWNNRSDGEMTVWVNRLIR